jgi:predicted Holliday junction resolvase-like endonuclease
LKVEDLIKNLKTSELYAECPCGEEFAISETFLFDGTAKPFPNEALEKQAEMQEELAKQRADLEKQIKQITEKTAKTTAAVNIGKTLEKVLPVAKDFKWVVPDTKVLGDPIDLLIFNGLSNGKVDSLSFVEVKSGAARLNGHQKSIRDAIADHKVSYGVFK